MDFKDIFINCSACGDEWSNSGNYRYRLIPSKPFRRKSLKLYQKFIKLNKVNSTIEKNTAIPRNTIEVRCGKCRTILRHSISKPIPKKCNATVRKSKLKMSQDLNAGLIIPSSLSLNSAPTPGFRYSSNQSSPVPNNSKLFDTSSQLLGKRKSESWNDKNAFELNTKQRKLESITKSKERNELRKSLQKSKSLSNSSKKSLDNFLN